MKYVIVGGVAGGATAAARIRRMDESGEILLLEKGKYISYANCGLPYYIGGTIAERDKLFLQTPASFGKRFNVDVRTEHEAVAIDTSERTITIRSKDATRYTEHYDKLLLSPGAVPVCPPLPGIDTEGIFTLRNVEDTDRIKSYITHRHRKQAVVVGAGFIGLEMAENLHTAGMQVSIVEMADQVMAPVDYSIASHVHQHLLQKGINLCLGQAVERFERHGEALRVCLKSGQTLDADVVILSIGVRPETSLAQTAGLELGQTGAIRVSEYLETSARDVYAVGDAVEYPHPLCGVSWLNYLAGPANRQGRIAADNMVMGNTTPYEGAIGTSIAKVFDLTVASTGLAAKKLRQLGIPYQSSTTHSSSHAGYYPGALPMTLKLTFEPNSGKLYGAQSVGYDGVDKRIDQIALLIKQGGTVGDLTRVEHAYAPPFSSAKDPIAIAGYVAGNILNGTMPVVSWREMKAVDLSQVYVLDVRTEEEFALGAIPGSINMPLDQLRDRLEEIPTDRPVWVYCAVGLRGYLALKILTGRGFTHVKNLSGGYKTFSTATAPLSPRPFKNQAPCRTETAHGSSAEGGAILRIDACGLQCPGPILKVKQGIDRINEGQRLEITATDAAFVRDAQAWCNTTGHRLIDTSQERGRYCVVIEKGSSGDRRPEVVCGAKAKTLILFSDDLDRALATFVLANGAAATGQKVTIFFTFWGLNVIKKVSKPKVKKDLFGKMFGVMLPSSSLHLRLSKMSMLGLGDRMMRHIMRKKGIESLESLRDQALDAGVEFIACQMSMDVMGVAREELLDGITLGGVATYMERAEEANINLFV